MGFVQDKYAYSPEETILAASETQILAELDTELQDVAVEGVENA